MPDADATVYFNWSGTVVEFSGTGYHDKVSSPLMARRTVLFVLTYCSLFRTGETCLWVPLSAAGTGVMAEQDPTLLSGLTFLLLTAPNIEVATSPAMAKS